MDSHGRSSEVSPEAMQARIQQARREAETLKDKIKRKKDELADTTRTLTHLYIHAPRWSGATHCSPFYGAVLPSLLTS